LFMKRALELEEHGRGYVSPNPMVGAVIVAADGKIIGEGYHHRFGGPHAEVCAINSVKESERNLLSDSTIYVTLEPCSHYGKTPPCAKLIIDTGIPRVVVGSADPFIEVSGKGIRMLREAGVEVAEDVLREECDALNVRFLTAHRLRRPWIQLKWAQSADGFMAGIDNDGKPFPVKFSTPVSSVWMHRRRSMVDAIMVGKNTLEIDHPRLDCRYWPGRAPRRVVPRHDLEQQMRELYDEGVTSLMVEGGPTLLQSFIDLGLYDDIQIETAEKKLGDGLPAPKFNS
ncbi:MAG: bifunctional diaminohydroxyphosphoribosylaminopyrimidine deaminase/5-amino-6-(5-phosphoribosylamino)uracil reductase RibD, partial [Muribaculaceae bacterium]|nr:bifunctional diaminohydroxyphosphoribosylaminopyrimidine deaminase/5-amino-6-(5-phosphoribosylamino)uracil reductase RibD [Muribaculaceae bacterium]